MCQARPVKTEGAQASTLRTHFLLTTGNLLPFQMPPAAWNIKDAVGSKDSPLPLKYLQVQGVPCLGFEGDGGCTGLAHPAHVAPKCTPVHYGASRTPPPHITRACTLALSNACTTCTTNAQGASRRVRPPVPTHCTRMLIFHTQAPPSMPVLQPVCKRATTPACSLQAAGCAPCSAAYQWGTQALPLHAAATAHTGTAPMTLMHSTHDTHAPMTLTHSTHETHAHMTLTDSTHDTHAQQLTHSTHDTHAHTNAPEVHHARVLNPEFLVAAAPVVKAALVLLQKPVCGLQPAVADELGDWRVLPVHPATRPLGLLLP